MYCYNFWLKVVKNVSNITKPRDLLKPLCVENLHFEPVGALLICSTIKHQYIL